MNNTLNTTKRGMVNEPITVTPPEGWACGHFDGFVGTRIYPMWQGALESKRLVMRDIRVQGGEFFVHNPWKNVIDAYLGDNIADVEAYILTHGRVVVGGANVWD